MLGVSAVCVVRHALLKSIRVKPTVVEKSLFQAQDSLAKIASGGELLPLALRRHPSIAVGLGSCYTHKNKTKTSAVLLMQQGWYPAAATAGGAPLMLTLLVELHPRVGDKLV